MSCIEDCLKRGIVTVPEGPIGPAGPDGPDGPIGLDGPTGQQGVDGQDGIDGSPGPSYAGTSASSVTLPLTGPTTESIIATTGLAYITGSRIRVADSGNPTDNFFEGIVTSYVTGTGAMDISFAAGELQKGSGTISSWNLSIAGDPVSKFVSKVTGAGVALNVENRIAPPVNTTASVITAHDPAIGRTITNLKVSCKTYIDVTEIINTDNFFVRVTLIKNAAIQTFVKQFIEDDAGVGFDTYIQIEDTIGYVSGDTFTLEVTIIVTDGEGRVDAYPTLSTMVIEEL